MIYYMFNMATIDEIEYIEPIQYDTITINEHYNKEQKLRKFVILKIKPKDDAKKQKKKKISKKGVNLENYERIKRDKFIDQIGSKYARSKRKKNNEIYYHDYYDILP